MLLGILGLRTSTLIAINIEDIDLTCGLIWIREKGWCQLNLVLTHTLCKIIHNYLQLLRHKYLSWAYVEAANFAIRYCAKTQSFYQRRKAKTNGIVAIKAFQRGQVYF